MPRRAGHARSLALVLTCAGLLGCRPGPPPPDAAQLQPPTGGSAQTLATFERARLRRALVRDDGLLLLGQRRPRADSFASEAWIAKLDFDGRIAWELGVGDRWSWAEAAAVDPRGGVHVLGRDAGRSAWLLRLTADGQQLGLERVEGEPSDGAPSLDLAGGVATIELGEHTLLLAQLPPLGDADARVEVIRAPHASAAELRTQLEREAARRWQPEPGPVDPLAWAWRWPFLAELDRLDPAAHAQLGAWLLDTRGCAPELAGTYLDTELLEFPIPAYEDPGDPCWKVGRVVDYLDTAARESIVDNFPALLELLLVSQVGQRWPGYLSQLGSARDRDIPAAIIDAAFEHGLGEAVIRALVLDAEFDSDAALIGVELLRRLDPDRALPLADELLVTLRADPRRCEEVRLLASFLVEHGRPSPVWTADPRSTCDLLYVLCTGLEPGLADRLIPARGYRIVETCGPDRPSDPDAAADAELTPCSPSRRRATTLEQPISPAVAAHCGTNEPVRWRLGLDDVPSEFATLRYEFRCDSAACQLARLDIVHSAE